MEEKAKKIISNWNEQLKDEVNFSLRVTDNKNLNKPFEDFCNNFSLSASNIKINTSKSSETKEPHIKIKDNLIYKAVPEGKELDIFLKLLQGESSISEKLTEQLQSCTIPATFKIFITPSCPFCPKVVSDLASMSFANENITITIIDGVLFSKLAEKDNITSAPTTLFGEAFRWTGTVNPSEIAEVLLNSKPEDLSLEALQNIIESGKASVLSDLMLQSDMIFPVFYDLLTHKKWPTRLGALVVMEEIAENRPALAEYAITELWKSYNSYDDSVKGDIIYITGEAGSLSTKELITKVLNGNPSAELKEAAIEANETLNERFTGV